MRTSLKEIKNIENYLFGRFEAGEKLMFDTRLILDTQMAEKVAWQKEAYDLVQQYGRKKLKSELEMVHQKLFENPEHTGFRQKILQIFSNIK